ARAEELLQATIGGGEGEQSRLLNVSWRLLTAAWLWGPTGAKTAAERCTDLLATDPPLRVAASAYRTLAVMHSLRGDVSNARMYAAKDATILHELGLKAPEAGMRTFHAMVEMNAGDPGFAVEMLMRSREILTRLSDRWFIGSVTALLAHALIG